MGVLAGTAHSRDEPQADCSRDGHVSADSWGVYVGWRNKWCQVDGTIIGKREVVSGAK